MWRGSTTPARSIEAADLSNFGQFKTDRRRPQRSMMALEHSRDRRSGPKAQIWDRPPGASRRRCPRPCTSRDGIVRQHAERVFFRALTKAHPLKALPEAIACRRHGRIDFRTRSPRGLVERQCPIRVVGSCPVRRKPAAITATQASGEQLLFAAIGF